MIKIYGSVSSSAGRSIWTAEETGQPYEVVPVDFKNQEHKGEAYLKLNPNGKVPVMVDGDFVMWESMAINTYLAEKYKPELLGSSVEQHGHVYQWSYWAIANLAHSVEILSIQKWRQTPDNEETAKAHTDIARFLPILEGALVGKDHLVGDVFTLADLNTASIIGALMWLQMDMTACPNILRWFSAISQRPAFQKTIGSMMQH